MCRALPGHRQRPRRYADEDNILRAAVASDGPSRALEEVQARTGQGPCVDSFVNRQVVTADDLGADNRWPESREALIRNGVRAVLGVPVVLGGVTIGSLDLYMDRPHRWDDSECDALVRYSRILEATLDAALRARHSGEIADQLQFALDNRVVIDRAVGFLMAAYRVDAVTAFDILRRTARNRAAKRSRSPGTCSTRVRFPTYRNLAAEAAVPRRRLPTPGGSRTVIERTKS